MIGIPVVFGLVLYRGFCLGYTIAVCINVMGLPQGLWFVLILLRFKLYKSIIKDRNKENVKIEVVRHTIFSFIMLLILVMSSLIEIFFSTSILKGLIKYF